MNELPIFPDVIEIIRDYLLDYLDDTPVFVDVPNDDTVEQHREPKFVRLNLTGGSQQNLVLDAPRVYFEAWGSTKAEAHDLAQEVRALMSLLPQEGGQIRKVSTVGNLIDSPDPLSKQQRFRFAMSVMARGTVYTPSS